MKKTIKTRTVVKPVEIEVSVYATLDGKEFEDEQSAKYHEDLLKKYPKLSDSAIEWIEEYVHSHEAWDGNTVEELEKALKSNKVIVIGAHSGGDDPFFEIVEPYLVAAEAVIKVLHRRSVGCNNTRYISGIIYLGESLCFNDEKKINGRGYYKTGSGRNIKEVLK